MRIHLNDTIVADTDSIVPDSYEVPKRKPLKPEDREDFSRDSATKYIQDAGRSLAISIIRAASLATDST